MMLLRSLNLNVINKQIDTDIKKSRINYVNIFIFS